MSSKSMVDSSSVLPQVGMGLARKVSSAACRNRRIQSGSFFMRLIISTTSWSMPLAPLWKYSSGSRKPQRLA